MVVRDTMVARDACECDRWPVFFVVDSIPFRFKLDAIPRAACPRKGRREFSVIIHLPLLVFWQLENDCFTFFGLCGTNRECWLPSRTLCSCFIPLTGVLTVSMWVVGGLCFTWYSVIILNFHAAVIITRMLNAHLSKGLMVACIFLFLDCVIFSHRSFRHETSPRRWRCSVGKRGWRGRRPWISS